MQPFRPIILCLRWSQIRLQLFLGFNPKVLFTRTMLMCCIKCAISHLTQLFQLGMCFVRLPLLLSFWPIGRTLVKLVCIFSVLRIFLQACQVFSIWMHWLFLTSGASIDGFPFLLAVFILFLVICMFFQLLLEVLVYVLLLVHLFYFMIYIIGKDLS